MLLQQHEQYLLVLHCPRKCGNLKNNQASNLKVVQDIWRKDSLSVSALTVSNLTYLSWWDSLFNLEAPEDVRTVLGRVSASFTLSKTVSARLRARLCLKGRRDWNRVAMSSPETVKGRHGHSPSAGLSDRQIPAGASLLLEILELLCSSIVLMSKLYTRDPHHWLRLWLQAYISGPSEPLFLSCKTVSWALPLVI